MCFLCVAWVCGCGWEVVVMSMVVVDRYHFCGLLFCGLMVGVRCGNVGLGFGNGGLVHLHNIGSLCVEGTSVLLC